MNNFVGQHRVVFRGRLADLVFCKGIHVTCDIANQEFAPMTKPTTNETPAVKPDTTPRVVGKWVLPDNCVIVERTGESLPVFPYEQTPAAPVRMSQKCHKRTHAPQQTASLFDHLVGTAEQRWRYGETE
jgi:hypothetical protein